MKRLKIHLIEKNRTYTTAELSQRLKIHPRTIQQWHKEGMPVINGSRPLLFGGNAVKIWLKTRRQSKKVLLDKNEFYCPKCKKAVQSITGSITFKKGYKMGRYTQIMIKGICNVCNSKINRFSSTKNIAEVLNLIVENKDKRKLTTLFRKPRKGGQICSEKRPLDASSNSGAIPETTSQVVGDTVSVSQGPTNNISEKAGEVNIIVRHQYILDFLD
jgi:transcriptional regulator NrdR family protein